MTEIIICVNCKDIFIGPIDKCDCGGKTFQQTHPSNREFAKNIDTFYSKNLNDNNNTLSTWDDIFEFQARKDGANYTMLKEWLKEFCTVPNIIEK